ncbi:MAG TPA: DUF2807 domain-containing protein [Saprospiraceae bacterium]|nr:DUF2807 domain-containing protein [Saprospiraceae bacterium]
MQPIPTKPIFEIKKTMKLIQTTTLFILLFAFSTIQAQRVAGKGDLVTKNHKVQPFDKLELSGVFNVTLRQGQTNEISIEAQENLQQYIIVEQRNHTLDIHFPKKLNLRKHKKINVEIVFTDLREIETSMVGNLKSDGTIKLNSLKWDNSSVGNSHLDLNVKNFEADLSAVGNVYLKGWARKADITSSIVGSLQAEDFLVDYLDIDNSSVGNVRIHADVELDIEHSGIGNLHYSGNANITDLSSSGIGKVKHD